MIETIAYKPEGQLEKIDIPANVNILPFSADLKIRNIDKNNIILVCNQLDNVSSIIELASSNLICSCNKVTSLICKKLYSNDDIDSKERISSDFLLNAMLYYNASFDYLRVLLKYIYTSYSDLIENYPQQKVIDKMQKLDLKKHWELALGYCITYERNEEFLRWLKQNCKISEKIKAAFKSLATKNRVLRIRYQTNQLKHGAPPHFKRSNSTNLINVKTFESIEQFYNKEKFKTVKLSVGSYENQLDIDEVQKFLIKYHNCTAKLINAVVKDIGLR
ncbi:MAG: hypothetical protein ABIL69_10955 [candidate division WOR-3 bacterium]